MPRADIRWCHATNIGAFAGVRSGSFLIFYRVGKDTIEIIHILHGARDYEALPFPGE